LEVGWFEIGGFDMKNFLAIYTGVNSSRKIDEWNAMDEKSRKERERAGIDAWMKWGQSVEKHIVDNGAPLGKTKLVDSKGISDIKNLMTGYTIVKAESHEAAAKLFRDHPHFSIFPGDSVEIMECLPLPGM